MHAPEATYLAWIDIRELQLEDAHAFFTEHGVGIAAGEEYEGPGFIRLNYGCPQSVLVEGLSRMSKAVLSRMAESHRFASSQKRSDVATTTMRVGLRWVRLPKCL